MQACLTPTHPQRSVDFVIYLYSVANFVLLLLLDSHRYGAMLLLRGRIYEHCGCVDLWLLCIGLFSLCSHACLTSHGCHILHALVEFYDLHALLTFAQAMAVVQCFHSSPCDTHSCAHDYKLWSMLYTLYCIFFCVNYLWLTLKVLNFWKFTCYCSLKPLWSGMGEVVPARTSLTLHPPPTPTVHQLSHN